MSFDNQQFDNFDQWVNHASSWLTSHAICFDTQGRRCKQGGDFQRARDENTFPITWVWPDQVPGLYRIAQEIIKVGGTVYPPQVPK